MRKFVSKAFISGDSLVIVIPSEDRKALKMKAGKRYLFELKATELNSTEL